MQQHSFIDFQEGFILSLRTLGFYWFFRHWIWKGYERKKGVVTGRKRTHSSLPNTFWSQECLTQQKKGGKKGLITKVLGLDYFQLSKFSQKIVLMQNIYESKCWCWSIKTPCWWLWLNNLIKYLTIIFLIRYISEDSHGYGLSLSWFFCLSGIL